jgi:hypothetical protein
MRGILVMITNITDDGEPTDHPVVTPMDLNANVDLGDEAAPPRFGCTPDEALDHVKGHERANVEFDMDCAESQGDVDAGTIAANQRKLADIDALAWPEAPNGEGHLALDSVWCLGLAEEGIEYRFMPITA